MAWWSIAATLGGLLLGSTVLSALVKAIFEARAAKRARKHTLEDRHMDDKAKKETLEEQFNQFRADQKKENAEIRQRLAGMEASMNTVLRSTKALVYNSIFSDAFAFIKHGNIAPEERLKLKSRVAQFIDDYGDNDTFKNVMMEIDNLRTRPLFEQGEGGQQ